MSESLDNKQVAFSRYASFPNEIFCTENLTPWKKLLPCVDKGLSGLLANAHKLFESQYLLIELIYKKSCSVIR
jgi:GPI-anchor transamidase subunit T